MENLHNKECNLNIRYDLPQDILNKLIPIYEKMPGWQGLDTPDGMPYWFGVSESEKHIIASMEPSGLQFSGKMENEDWDLWITQFKHIATEILGFKVGEIETGEVNTNIEWTEHTVNSSSSSSFEELEDVIHFTDREIFTKIWTTPRLVFRYINDNNYDKYVYGLLVFAGIFRAFDRAISKNMGDAVSLPIIILTSILIGGLLGWLSFYIYAALLNWTGKWLNAKGNTSALLDVLAYAMIPNVVSLLFLIVQIGIFGIALFQSNGELAPDSISSILVGYGAIFISLIFSLWTIVLSVIGISEVQKLSIGKTILNCLLPLFVIIVPIALLVMLFTGL